MSTAPLLAFLDSLAIMLAGTWPPGSPDPLAAARAALADLAPRDIIEATLASRIIAAHHAELDSYRRAMQPGLNDADAARMRSNAVSAGRASEGAVRTLEKRRAPPKEAAAARTPRAQKAPSAPELNPVELALAPFTAEEIAAAEISLDNDPADLARNELAKRIPLGNTEDMTMEERRIAYAPRGPMTPVELAVLGARIAAGNRNRVNGAANGSNG